MQFDFKKILPHIVAVVVIILVNVVYFFPQFQGKKLQQGDIISFQGMAAEATEYHKKGEDILWTNAMFGGMPTYQITATEKSNFAKHYQKILSTGFKAPTGYFILGMLSFYICLLLLGANPWVSLVGSILFAFSTSNMILYEAGHTNKIKAIMTAAPIIAGVMLVLKRKYLLGGFVFALFMSINLYSNHPQMTYYLGIALVFLMIMAFANAIKEKTLPDFGKAVVVLVLGTILSVGTFASKTLTTLEYSEDTMRGKPILKTEKEATSSSQTDGLQWDYAMNWSNGLIDIMASWIPKVAGGGSVEMLTKDSKFAKTVGARKAVQAPTYFGALTSTAGPLYMGAVVFFLFVFSIVFAFFNQFKYREVVFWGMIAVFVTFLLSMGKNLEWFNKLWFDYFPMYNKFRTPNSVTSITGVIVAVTAFFGLNQAFKIENKNNLVKPLLISFGILGGLTLIVALIGPSLFSLSGSYDARIGQPKVVDALIDDRISMMRSSSLRSLFLMLIVAGGIFAYAKEKINGTILLVIIAFFGLFDLVQVDRTYLGSKDWVSARKIKTNFQKRDVDLQILNDTDPHYRVHDVTIDPFNSSQASNFHKTVGGYHAAKLQRIQDIIERYISKGDQRILNMMNTKYFIIPNEGRAVVQRNTAALGNAWFVNNVKMVEDANAEIDALASFDPSLTAVVHKEFTESINGVSPSKSGSINLTKYHPEKLEFEYETPSDNLAVFSEVWYGPDKGWKAYVDGNEIPLLRANYLLRAAKLPAGKHKLTMEFAPKTFKMGETISLISSILLLLLGVFVGYKSLTGKLDD